MYSTWYHFCLSKQFTSLLPLHIYEFIYTLVGTPQSFLISSSNLAFFFLPQILNLWLIPSYSNPLFVSLFYNTLFLSHLMSRLHSLSPSLTTLSTSSFWYLSLSPVWVSFLWVFVNILLLFLTFFIVICFLCLSHNIPSTKSLYLYLFPS